MDMEGAGDEQYQESIAKFVRTIGEILNSISIEKRVEQAGVYDNAQIILTSSRIPCPRANGKDNYRDENGKRWKGNRREPNVANWGDQTLDNDNHHQIQEGEYEQDDGYQEISGGQPTDVRYTGKESESPSDLDWGNW